MARTQTETGPSFTVVGVPDALSEAERQKRLAKAVRLVFAAGGRRAIREGDANGQTG